MADPAQPLRNARADVASKFPTTMAQIEDDVIRSAYSSVYKLTRDIVRRELPQVSALDAQRIASKVSLALKLKLEEEG